VVTPYPNEIETSPYRGARLRRRSRSPPPLPRSEVPAQIAISMIETGEGSVGSSQGRLNPGLSDRIRVDESPFDCVAFFNPTTRAEYDATVNGWADGLLLVINSSIAAREAAAKMGT